MNAKMQAKKLTKPSDSFAISDNETFEALVSAIRACRVCRDQPRYGKQLAHEPRPIIQVSVTARICIASQAPGTRVHDSGRAFDDPSGARLRQWLGVNENEFYDPSKIAIIPMGFCFPGLRPDGSDLSPRRECAEIWRTRLFAQLPKLELLLVIGSYAQRWHLGPEAARRSVDETVRLWRQVYRADTVLRVFPLPHPSWHNNRWLTSNSWFETDMLPVLQADIRNMLS
jgi:uracil-DNA glycosylase